MTLLIGENSLQRKTAALPWFFKAHDSIKAFELRGLSPTADLLRKAMTLI